MLAHVEIARLLEHAARVDTTCSRLDDSILEIGDCADHRRPDGKYTYILSGDAALRR
jgi:hypothetical protein